MNQHRPTHHASPALMTPTNIVLSAVLLGATVTYLFFFPRNLGHADEGLYLYEAKRILQGEVLYRDVFDFVAPGAWYAMAFLYWVFGTNIETAKMCMAVLHGATAAVLFLTGRQLGIRVSLCLVVPVAYVGLCQPTWPFASPHWFSTFLCVVLLFTMFRAPWWERPRWAIVPGIVNGCLIAVQQQRGCLTAAGVGVLLVILHLLSARGGRMPPWRHLIKQLAWFGAGIALVAVPTFLTMIVVAGWTSVYDALVVFPLFNYRKAIGTKWGSLTPLSRPLAAFTDPRLLRNLPLILPILFARGAWYAARGTAAVELRTVTILLLFGLFSIASIMYYPDFIHVAFIAPVLFLAIAETTERLLTVLLRRRRLVEIAGWAVALLLLVPLGRRLTYNFQKSWAQTSIPYETEFGLVHFSRNRDIELIQGIREVMRGASSRELFVYPVYPSLYLMTDTHNPTPFQLLRWGGYNPPEHMERVLQTLRTKNVPYVVILIPFVAGTDPILQFVMEHYDPGDHPLLQSGALSGSVLFQRRTDDGTQPTADQPGSS